MRAKCNLVAFRGERTIQEMADKAGIPRPYLSQIEAGRRLPTDQEAVQIAKAYGVALDQMYDWQPMSILGIGLEPEQEPA